MVPALVCSVPSFPFCGTGRVHTDNQLSEFSVLRQLPLPACWESGPTSHIHVQVLGPGSSITVLRRKILSFPLTSPSSSFVFKLTLQHPPPVPAPEGPELLLCSLPSLSLALAKWARMVGDDVGEGNWFSKKLCPFYGFL